DADASGAIARKPFAERELAAERTGPEGVEEAAQGGATGVQNAVQRSGTSVDDNRDHVSTSL
ncbi:hypothetical protein, partial [Nocardia sp. NPDC004722]